MINNIDNAIKVNREMYNNLPKLKEANIASYSCASDSFNNKVQYYNDPKKKTKAKIYAAATTGIMALVGMALLFKAKGAKSIQVKDIIEQSKKGAEYIKEKRFGDKFNNISSNIVNVKDDIWDKFVKKVAKTPLKFLKSIGDWITNVYKNGITASFSSKYNNAIENLRKANYEDADRLLKFDEWFEKTNNTMYETLHQEGKKVTDGLFNKDIFKKMSESNIADDKLARMLEKEIIKTPKGASKELEKAIHEFNDIKGTLLPKMRDVNCGSAPTDLLTIVMSTLGLGVAIGVSDDKEEKKSTAINLGIPLLTTLGCTTFGTLKCLSGAKSLLFGLVMGKLASVSAKAIDKATSKDKKQ